MNLTKKEAATLTRLRRKWATKRATRAQILRVMELQRKRDAKPDGVTDAQLLGAEMLRLNRTDERNT